MRDLVSGSTLPLRAHRPAGSRLALPPPSLTPQTCLRIFETADDCLVLMSQAQVPEGRTRGWEASRAPSGQPCWVCTAVGPQGGEAVAGLHTTAEGPPGSPSPRVSADNEAGRELTRLRPH